jgi:hypothetical protein
MRRPQLEEGGDEAGARRRVEVVGMVAVPDAGGEG